MILSLSHIFLFIFFPVPHHLAGSAKANQIEVVSSALAGLTDWKQLDLLQPSGHECHSLHSMVASSLSNASQLPYYKTDCEKRLPLDWGWLCSTEFNFAQRFCWGLKCFGLWLHVSGIFHLRWRKYCHSKQQKTLAQWPPSCCTYHVAY